MSVSLLLRLVAQQQVSIWPFVNMQYKVIFLIDEADYDVELFSLEFTASEYNSMNSVCHSIMLHEDLLLELTETILFELNSTNSFVIINQNSAVFTIQDSVRYLHNKHKCLHVKTVFCIANMKCPYLLV